MRVLGIDPGTVRMGYGVVDEEKHQFSLVACGVLRAPARLSIERRLLKLHQGLQELIARYQPEAVAVEEPFVAKNVRAAMAIGGARAIAILAAAAAGAPVAQYSPRKVKQAVTSYGASSKDQVQQMVGFLLGPIEPLGPDAADALAVALCHLLEGELNRARTPMKGSSTKV